MTHEERCQWILDQVKDHIGEHCEAFVFIATVKEDDGDGSSSPMTWDGGFNHALGLATRVQQDLLDSVKKQNPPAIDDGDDWKAGSNG